MRVLVLPKEFPSAQRPQAGIFIQRRVQALRELGHELEVVRIVPHAPPIGAKWNAYRAIPDFEDVDGIRVRTIRAVFPPRMIGMEYLPLQVHRAIRREIERFHPDVLHASFLIPCGQIAVGFDLPTVVTAHGGDAYSWPNKRPGLRRAAREAIVKATRVTAVSHFIAGCVQAIAPREVDVIWNGGDERFFYPRSREEMRARFNLPPHRLVIAFAGNILRAKGLFELVDAAAALVDLRPIVLAAGTGGDSSALEEYSQSRSVDMRLLGRLDSERVGELFAAADLVTLPSHNEGLPNVVCEAMLAGRAVVATTVGGIPEILDDGRTGLLVPPHDALALANALRRVSENVELRAHLAEAARAFAQQHLTWRISAANYDRVYRQAVNESSPSRPSSRFHTQHAS